MTKRTRIMISMLLVVSLLSSIAAFGAEKNEGRVKARISTAGEYAETDSNTVYFDYDFDGREGNYLIAVNPEPWYGEENSEYYDFKVKELGYLAGNGKTAALYEDQPDHRMDPLNTHKCLSMELKERYKADPKVKIRTAEDSITPYKAGDVILRIAAREIISDSILTTDIQEDYGSKWVGNVYQCLYAGEFSTIWGSVSYDNLTAEEQTAVKKMNDALYEKAKTDPDEGYEDTGIIGSSEDYDRTVLYDNEKNPLSRNDIEDMGKNIDHYILEEKKYTGDYLKTDSMYGDNDGKAAFFFEPFSFGAFGCFINYDLDEENAGKSMVDCLHLNVNTTLDNEDILYTTILHELQHCILYGYMQSNSEIWLNEWMAQGVSMQVYGQNSDDIKEYADRLMKYSFMNSDLLSPYAYSSNVSNETAYMNCYSVAYPLTQYFIEHVDDKFVKTWTENLDSCTTKVVSDYLRKKTDHSLEGWMSCFGIAFAAGLDGTEPNVKKGSDYDIGDSDLIKIFKEKLDSDIDKVRGSLLSFSDITEGGRMVGGGTVRGFKNASDRKASLLEVEDGVVWALRNSKGEIVSVEGLDRVDDIDRRNYTGKTVSVDGKIPVTVNIRMLSSTTFSGKKKHTADDLDLRVYLTFQNASDKDKINIGRIGIGTLTLKNYKKVFQYDGVSDRKKNPCLSKFVLKALPGASSDEKALIKDINKAIKAALKSGPLYYDIVPCPIDKNPIKLTINKDNTKVKKAVCFFGNKKYKLKKEDFKDILAEGKVIGIEGTGNFSGQYYRYYDGRVEKAE